MHFVATAPQQLRLTVILPNGAPRGPLMVLALLLLSSSIVYGLAMLYWTDAGAQVFASWQNWGVVLLLGLPGSVLVWVSAWRMEIYCFDRAAKMLHWRRRFPQNPRQVFQTSYALEQLHTVTLQSHVSVARGAKGTPYSDWRSSTRHYALLLQATDGTAIAALPLPDPPEASTITQTVRQFLRPEAA